MEDKARGYIEALGGAENIKDIEGCITRLRGEVVDPSKINAQQLTRLGAIGRPIVIGKGVQVVVGTYAELIGSEINTLLKQR